MSLDLFSQLLAIVAPVAISAGIGYLWTRIGFPFDVREITRLVTYVGTPCLVASALLAVDVEVSILLKTALAALLVIGMSALAGFSILKILNLPLPVFLPSLIFANTGNMGLPLCLFAFGDHGLALAVAFFCVGVVGQFTIGQALASGRPSFRTLLRSPVIWAVLIAVTLLATGTRLPLWGQNTIELLGQMTIPLMLLALGISLARLRAQDLLRTTAFSALRVYGGMALGFAVAWALDLQGTERGVIILQASMPVAVFNYLFAQLYGNRPQEVAGMVLLSTMMSFLSLPILLPFLL